MKLKAAILNFVITSQKHALNYAYGLFIVVFTAMLFYVPKIKVTFDFQSLISKDSPISYFKLQNTISVAVATKDGSELDTKMLCHIRSTIDTLSQKFFVQNVDSPFKISTPYNEDKKLLFKPLLDFDCKDVSEFQKTIKNYPSLSYITNSDFSDLMFSFELDKDQSVTTIEKWLKTELREFNIYYSGHKILMNYINQILLSDWIVNLAVILIFSLLFIVFFRSIQLGCIYLFTLVLTSGIILCLFPFFNLSLNPLSASIFIILMIASIEDFIFLVNDYAESRDMDQTLNRFTIPGLLTSLTTIIGFGSLALSDIRDIRIFGILTSIGAILEWFIIFNIAPALIEKYYTKNPMKFLFTQKLNSFRPKKILFYLSLIPVIVALLSIPKLTSDDNVENIFFKDHPYHRNTNYFSDTRGWKREFYILLNKDVDVLSDILKIEGVDNIQSFSGLVKDLTKDLDENSKKYLEEALEVSELHQRFKHPQGSVAKIRVKESSLSDLKEVTKKVSRLCENDQCTLFGRSVDFARYSDRILQTLYKSFATSFLLILAFLAFLSFKKLGRISFAIIYSALWGPLVMIGVFSLLNIPLNFISCIFFSVYLGLAGDNAVQYLFNANKLENPDLEKIGTSSVHITFFTVLGSLAITLSGFKFTAELGLYFAFGFILNFIGDYYILKSNPR